MVMVMLSVSHAGKTAYSSGKTSGVLRGGALGANRVYVLAHFDLPSPPFYSTGLVIVNYKHFLPNSSNPVCIGRK